MSDTKKFAVIMAGGGGTRFWPLSRRNMPKQLLSLSGNDAMINETIKRCEPLIPVGHTFIVTNKRQAKVMDTILMSSLPRENILKEPVPRNTAPCILFAAMHIYEKYGDGIMCVFPSDHYITEEQAFLSLLDEAVHVADETGQVVTIGVKPRFPATGYGYIKRDNDKRYGSAYKLDRFVEKPNLDKAREYVNSGMYYWNSGMFIWKVSRVIDAFERFLPRIYHHFEQMRGVFCSPDAQERVDALYGELDSISIDYGVMERTDEAVVIPGDFGWNDIGSWDALGAVFPADEQGNITKADHVSVDTRECIIYGSQNKLIATVGIHNTVIVDTEDAILVCAKDRAQDVKYVVEQLIEQRREVFL